MADYTSGYTGAQIDGSVASSSLYFSGAGASAHISASGNISGSKLYVNDTIYGNIATFGSNVDANNISASGNISGSGIFSSAESNFIANITSSGHISCSATISASGIFTPGASLHIGSEHITSTKWNRLESGRKPQSLTINTFTVSDFTPDISTGSIFKTHTSGTGTNITTFNGGDAGDEITVICSNNKTTIRNGSDIKMPGGAHGTCAADDVYRFVYDGTNWYTISFSDNS